MQFFLQTLVGGIGIGAIYVLVALGFSLVYRAMGLVNFAHGDILMIGAYIAATLFARRSCRFGSQWLSPSRHRRARPCRLSASCVRWKTKIST